MGHDAWEYLLIDDCSQDRSWEELLAAQRRTAGRIRLFRHRQRGGQGAAQQTGLFFAQGEVVVTLDADLQLFPEDMPLVFWSCDRVIDAAADAAPDIWRRHLGFLLDGLRAEAATPLPVGPMTRAQVNRARSRR